MTIRTIVVAAHGDDRATADALALGIRVARSTKARIVLAGVWASPLGPGDGIYERVARTELEHELARVEATVPPDVPCTTEIRGATSVVRGLHGLVDEVAADLLVLGPTHLGSVARVALGDLAATAFQDAPCAIVVAPAQYATRGADEPGDVVVGYDDNPESRAALEQAIELAAATGSRLRVVHVLETPHRLRDRPWAASPAAAAWFAELWTRAQGILDAGLQLVGGRVPVEGEVLEGFAPTVLARAAGDAFLLVVGSRGYGPIRRLVLGSTSSTLVHRAEVPVLVVPRPEAPGPA